MFVLLAAVGVVAPTAAGRSPGVGTPHALQASHAATPAGRKARPQAPLHAAVLTDEASSKARELLAGYLSFDDPDVSAAARRYRIQHRGEIFSVIATVPDPDKSDFDVYFDQEIDSIRAAARSAMFGPDRFSLPWKEASGEPALDLDLTAEPGNDDPRRDGLADRYRVKHHEDDVAERLPGLMLFRRQRSSAAAATAAPAVDLLVVIVVGETPTQGIHRQALKTALALSDRLRAPDQHSHDLLAPFFSASMASLRLALDEHRGAHSARSRQRHTTAISGSANGALRADDLGEETTFRTTSHSAQDLRAAMLAVLQIDPARRLDVGGVAELTEGTSWGNAVLAGDGKGEMSRAQQLKIASFEFPLHVAQLRSEREKLKQESASDKTANLRTKLELHLDHAHQSVDEVWVHSALTPYGVELMLQQQLMSIARENYRYLGIAATDPADLIFLAGEVRKYCPKVQLFTLGSNLLFTHPDVMRDLNGMLVASTYPLAGTRSMVPGMPGEPRLTFVSQEAEGIFNALSALLFEMGAQVATGDQSSGRRLALHDYVYGHDTDPRPPIWISMVSNGALWPFRAIPMSELRNEGEPPKPLNPIMYPGSKSGKDALGSSEAPQRDPDTGPIDVFFVLLALGIAVPLIVLMFAGGGRGAREQWPPAWVMKTLPRGLGAALVWLRAGIGRSVPGEAPPGCPDALRTARLRYLLGIWFPAWFGSALLFIVFRHLQSDQLDTLRQQLHQNQPVQTYGWLRQAAGAALTLFTTVAISVGFVRLAKEIRHLWVDRHAFHDAGVSGVCACGMVLVGAGLAVGYLCSLREWSSGSGTNPDGLKSLGIDPRDLAIDRILQPLSGVSPALPLLFLAAGLAAWGYFGLRRVREQGQFPDATPFPPAEGLASTGLGALAESVRANRTARLFTPEHGAGICVTLFLAFYFAIKLRPTLEDGPFDQLFLGGFLVLLWLVMANAGRTVAAWLELRRLLRRLAGHPMADAYDRVGASSTRAVEVELGARVPHSDELESGVRMGEMLARDPPPFAKAKTVELFQHRLQDEVELARRAYTQELEGRASDARVGTQAALFRLARTIFGVLERLWSGDAAPDSPESIQHVVDGVIPAETQAEGPYRHVHTLALHRRLATPGAQIWQRLAEDLVASQVVTLLKLGLGRIRSMMTFGVIGALLLVCAVSAYPFQPARFVTLFTWATALSVMSAVIWVVFGIERDEVLSRIAQTRPGHVDLKAAFLARIAIYGGVPIVALLATSFPQTGAVLFSWLEPLLRALH
jgi:hypothetical protein